MSNETQLKFDIANIILDIHNEDAVERAQKIAQEAEDARNLELFKTTSIYKAVEDILSRATNSKERSVVSSLLFWSGSVIFRVTVHTDHREYSESLEATCSLDGEVHDFTIEDEAPVHRSDDKAMDFIRLLVRTLMEKGLLTIPKE